MLLNVKPLQVKANNICKEMSQHYKSLELLLKELRDTTQELSNAYERADRTVNIGKLGVIGEWYSGLRDAFADWE